MRRVKYGFAKPFPTGCLGSGDADATALPRKAHFYQRRIAEETRSGEPELALLAKVVQRGGTAIDVGANLGFFAYALSDIADWVVDVGWMRHAWA